MSEYPGRDMPEFPIEWYVIDEERGWVVCQVWNRMRDPGDGSVHQEYNFTLLKYAGDGRWSYEEDIYNPMRFGAMVGGVGGGHGSAAAELRLRPGRPDRGRTTVQAWSVRRLGRTGHHSSVAILGGAAFWDVRSRPPPRRSSPRRHGGRGQPPRRGPPVRPGPGAARAR